MTKFSDLYQASKLYLKILCKGKFNSILININIDGAGYKAGKSAFSFLDLPENLQKNAEEV